MLDDTTIQSAVARLVAAATSPSQVILFGSYARGTADEGSDLDLLVIEREIPNKADEYMRLRDALGRLAPGVGVDLLLYQEYCTLSGARYRATFYTEPGMKARYCMTPFTDEAKRLLRIAGRDYQTFTILRNHPEAELAPTCFHAQQAVEKALKAVLTIKHIDFRRTHDLEELANLLADIGIAPPFAPREFRRLNPFAVEFRYDVFAADAGNTPNWWHWKTQTQPTASNMDGRDG